MLSKKQPSPRLKTDVLSEVGTILPLVGSGLKVYQGIQVAGPKKLKLRECLRISSIILPILRKYKILWHLRLNQGVWQPFFCSGKQQND